LSSEGRFDWPGEKREELNWLDALAVLGVLHVAIEHETELLQIAVFGRRQATLPFEVIASGFCFFTR
jgi:hypothetical protein